MKNLKQIVLVLCVILALACKETKKNEDTAPAKDKKESKTPISLSPLTGSPVYANATLKHAPEKTIVADTGKITFNFTVENYVLGNQTQSPNSEKLANSGKGQHIHFILNNQPYSAHYESSFTKEIPKGVHHLVAFLSRSYHESVKNNNSVVIKKLMVGANPKDSLGLNMQAPTLIYSRPKGTYVGKDSEHILLDFFVLNTQLSESGNKVRATINNTPFIITEWKPQVITGLSEGETTIKLELIDKNGDTIKGPFNSVTRKITLKK